MVRFRGELPLFQEQYAGPGQALCAAAPLSPQLRICVPMLMDKYNGMYSPRLTWLEHG